MIGVIIVIVIVLAIIFWIGIKVDKLKERTMQHILKDTPLSESNMRANWNNAIGGRVEERFLKDFPNYTKESLDEFIQQTVSDLREKRATDILSEKVKQKMVADEKLVEFLEKTYKRTAIEAYGNGRFNVTVIYADEKDEYGLALFYKIQNNQLILDEYSIKKGAMLGF